MQDVVRGSRWVVAASAVAMLGWGTVLPYQYAYAAETRGWGGAVAAVAASLFSVAALVAGPVGGRLADRFAPALVAVVAKLAAALAAGALVLADTPTAYVAGMTAFGFALAAAGRPSPSSCSTAAPAVTAARPSPGSPPGRRWGWASGRSPRATWSTSPARTG